MSGLEIARVVGGLIGWATFLIIGVFGNFLIRKSKIGGTELPADKIHAILGLLLIVFNSGVLVSLAAFYKAQLTPQEIAQVRNIKVQYVLGPIANPFYVGSNRAMSAVGYAFLIILWWLGFHSFLYSLNLNPESPWLFGWGVLVSVVYLALGLASIVAIQSCWQKLGFEAYQLKWICGFIGIPIGAFLPPILLRLGLPELPFKIG